MLSYDIEPELEQLSPILDNKYKILETIGQGRYSKVKLGQDMETKKYYAIKVIRENQINTDEKIENFIREVEILSELNHQNIIKIISVNLNGEYKKQDGRISHVKVFYINKVAYYVMRYAKNGELYDYLLYTPIFSEKTSRYYFKQLIDGITYLQNQGFVHLDIKPENLLLSKDFTLKIADFGFSQKLGKKFFFKNKNIGSPEYNPPEISNNSSFFEGMKLTEINLSAVDIFTSTVVLFLFVMNSAPFNCARNEDNNFKLLSSNNEKKWAEFWKVFSANCEPSENFKELVQGILAQPSNNRLTLDEIKEHAWFQESIPTKEEIKQEFHERMNTIRKKKLPEIKQRRMIKVEKLKNKQNDFANIPYVKKNNNIEILKLKYFKTIKELNDKIQKINLKKKNNKLEIMKNLSEDSLKKKRQKKNKKFKKIENKKNEEKINEGVINNKKFSSNSSNSSSSETEDKIIN